MTNDLVGLGKLSESIEKGTKEVRQLAYDFLSPSVKEAGQLIADKIRFNRISNSIKAMKKAKEMIKSAGIPQRPINLKTFTALIESCSLEENEEMVNKWAGLLASAATDNSFITSFVHILSQMSPYDAQLLDAINGMTQPIIRDKELRGIGTSLLQKITKTEFTLFLAVLGNLFRLGLVYRFLDPNAFISGNPPLGFPEGDNVALTPLGKSFMQACSGPKISELDEKK